MCVCVYKSPAAPPTLTSLHRLLQEIPANSVFITAGKSEVVLVTDD